MILCNVDIGHGINEQSADRCSAKLADACEAHLMGSITTWFLSVKLGVEPVVVEVTAYM